MIFYLQHYKLNKPKCKQIKLTTIAEIISEFQKCGKKLKTL